MSPHRRCARSRPGRPSRRPACRPPRAGGARRRQRDAPATSAPAAARHAPATGAPTAPNGSSRRLQRQLPGGVGRRVPGGVRRGSAATDDVPAVSDDAPVSEDPYPTQPLPGLPLLLDDDPADGEVADATFVRPDEADPTTYRRRVRARLARRLASGGQRPSGIQAVLEPLVATHRAAHPKADLRILQRAYDIAEEQHRGQLRKSGDPYITHPLAVATILAELGMDTTTLVAALLHDTVEDTGYTPGQRQGGLRRRGGAPRRRRDQARQGQVRRRRRGRDDPQDDRRDGPRPAGAGHQARRPAAQHAHAAVPAAGQAGAERPADAGGARPAGPPARHEHGEVGAGGPRLRHPLPEALRRDRPAGGRAGPVAGHLPGPGGRAGLRRPARGPGQGDRDRPAEALLLDLPEDDRPRPRLHRHLRPGRHPGPGRLGPRLLRDARRRARDLAAGAGPVQGLHRDAEVQHVPVAAHHRDRPRGQAGRAADPHAGHAPHGRVRHRRALEVQGDQGRRLRRRATRTCSGCASCSTGSGRRRSRGSSSSRCASTSARARSSSSPPRAT